MKEVSVEGWQRRLKRAADLLTARLDDPPLLAELAAAAAVSPFHFHRIWRALTGETVGQSTLRLRVEASQELLRKEGATVTETAAAVGFGTPQSFARAFRRHTGLTPSMHRGSQEPIARDNRTMKVTIEKRGEVLVVALRREGKPYSDLNATFATLWSWAESTDALKGLQGIYGVQLDDPMSVSERELRYEACLALGVASVPEPFRTISLPAGDYACLRHLGPYGGLESDTQCLMGEWLTSSNREPADFPVTYHFLNDPDQVPVEQLMTDILLPLEARNT